MKETILIVEDQFVEADYLRILLTKADYRVLHIARSVTQAQEIISKERPDFVLLDIFLKGNKTGIDLAWELQTLHIPFVYLSANSNEEVLKAAKATHPYGFLVKPFREKDLLVTLEIARYRHVHSIESRLLKEESVVSQLNQILGKEQSWKNKLMEVGRTLQAHIPFDFLGTHLLPPQDISEEAFSFLRIGYDEYQPMGMDELSTITGLAKSALKQLMNTPCENDAGIYYNDQEFERIIQASPLKKVIAQQFQMQSHLCMPLHLSNGKTFQFSFYSRRADAYTNEQVSFSKKIEPLLKKAVEKIFNPNGVTTQSLSPVELKPLSVPAFDGIIGKSHLLLNVLDNVSLVASSGTSVLILGDSGTGKERIADCIHRLSPRNGKPFIKVNCAALPPTLIESELFGHEKGSFTGAIDKRIGKFEQADKGTIFLDEIGELPLEFQAKLLRVLQEKEVERIGSKAATKIDIRIVAATNRNLEKEVADGRFRLDLYYRLNVFPIVLPSLSERKEDIPDLTSYFIEHYNKKTGKKIEGVSAKVRDQLMAYHWPGNIRELEHLIERSILLTKSAVIDEVQIPKTKERATVTSAGEEEKIKTIHENERDHILAVLRKCKGKIWGAGAAAELLNIPPSTLKSKMKKLGIGREYMELK